MTALPLEIYNHLITFRPVHPVAKLIREFKRSFSYCVVCHEKERFQTMKCCSSDCARQFADGNFYEEGFQGDIFERFVTM